MAFITHVWYYIKAVDRISFSYLSCMTLRPVTIPFNTIRVWTFIANTSFDPRKKIIQASIVDNAAFAVHHLVIYSPQEPSEPLQ
jgi:hypothetical protein